VKIIPSVLCVLAAALSSGAGAADTAQSQLAEYARAAGAPGQAERGRTFFTANHGGDWSCSTCHTATPTVPGKHATTGKAILPLAPAFAPERFTDSAKTEKWFRRNCKDVVARECTPQEKADLLAWLLTLKP